MIESNLSQSKELLSLNYNSKSSNLLKPGNLSGHDLSRKQDNANMPRTKSEIINPTQEDKYSTSWLSKSKDDWSNYNNGSKGLRLDNKGHPIIRGMSQYHISFADKTKSKIKFIDVIQVESFKLYNTPSKCNFSAVKSGFCVTSKSECCLIS